MTFKPASAFDIVRLIDLQLRGETGFCTLVDATSQSPLIPELQEELAIQTSGLLRIIDVTNQTVSDLIKQLLAAESAVVLMHGFETWDEGRFASLDINRSGLETGSFFIFSVDLITAGRFLDNAPNIRSFIGANIFARTVDPSAMSAEEIANRLGQLRSYYGMGDDEVLRRAARADLPAEPHFAEWLLLLGRSELAR